MDAISIRKCLTLKFWKLNHSFLVVNHVGMMPYIISGTQCSILHCPSILGNLLWSCNQTVYPHLKGVFGWQRKVRGKKGKGKIVRGKKIEGKWVESKMIFWLFDMSESENKIRGKKDIFNNSLTLQI
jgi:hypothetical protein